MGKRIKTGDSKTGEDAVGIASVATTNADQALWARPAPLRDGNIRELLERWLKEEHRGDPDAVVLHELTVPRFAARVDVAAVNGELCGFEIKSDVDSLSRLPRQVLSFSSVFERVTVVTTERHLAGVTHTVPDWWGIASVSEASSGSGITTVRKPGANPAADPRAQLGLLTLAELRSALPGVPCRARRNMVVDAILDECDADNVAAMVRAALKMRAAGSRAG